MNKHLLLILTTLLIISCGKNNKAKKIDSDSASIVESQVENLIKILIIDSKRHQEIGAKLTDSEITDVEKKLGIPLPYSYKLFLKQFGNGAYWLYGNAIDDINHFSYLEKYHKELGKTIQLVGGKSFEVNSLLCLMTEDSNGGAWVWLTSENSNNGEWPLAYYSLHDKKLHYKVENFTAWLRLLTTCKSEVIRKLDTEEILGLG